MKQVVLIGLLAFVACVSATSSSSSSEEITCEKPLCYTPDVLYPVLDQPQQYYKCISMLWPVIRTCHDDLYFDYYKQDCVVEEDFTDVCNGEEPEPTEEPEIPTTTEDPLETVSCEKPRCLLGSKKRHPVRDVPNFYYECEGIFKPVMKKCPTRRYFNYYEQECVKKSEWVDACEPLEPETTTTEEPTTTTEAPLEQVSCEKPRCLLGLKKRYPVRDVPRFYYECEGIFKPKMKKCPLFYFFNYYTQDCVKRNQWVDACEPIEPTPEPTTTTEEPTTTEETPEKPSCKKPLCLTVTKKRFPVKGEPESYYICVDRFEAEKQSCAFLRYFDYYSQKCVRKSEHTNVCDSEPEPTTEEPSTTTPEPSTTTPVESTTVDVPTCRKPLCVTVTEKRFPVKDEPQNYYICVDRFESKKESCGFLRYFDYYSQECVRKSEHQNVCDFEEPSTTEATTEVTSESTPEPTTEESSSTTEDIPSTTVDIPSCRPPMCLTHTEKLFPVKDLPNMYYECESPFVSRRKLCPENRYFDYYKQSCVRKFQWTNLCGDFQPLKHIQFV